MTNARAKPAARRDDPFRVLVESVKDYAIFMLDRTGRVATWNAGAEIIKGYTAGEVVGQHISLFYTPEDRARGHAQQLLGRAEAEGRVEEEGWRVRKDGSRFWADVVITVLRDDAGTVSGFAKVTRDLTERRLAETERQHREEALRRSEERFRLLVDSVSDYAIFILDPQGRVATWNSGAERLKGYKASEIIGSHFSRFRLEEEIAAGHCQDELEAAARDGRVEAEGWRLRRDGSRFWAGVLLTAIRGASGDLLGFAKITRDLTERRHLDAEREQRIRAEEAVRLRDEFLSIASHELKTPLSALQIDLISLQERISADEPQIGRRVARTVRSADRMASLVESLLDVARITGGQMAFKPERLDLSEALANVVDSLRGTAAKVHSDLTFTTPGPVWGRWDRLRIDQVAMNILSNALKYAAGTPVRVTLSIDGGHAIFEIADGGPGIPEPDLGRIFERFERAASARHYGGLGLGLYVAREIVEAQGGTISARNLPGGGAAFTVRLPFEGGAPIETAGREP